MIFCSSVFAQSAVKLDEFSAVNCDDYLARMDNVISEAQKNPTAKVHVFFYEGSSRTYYGKKEKALPVRGSVKAKTASMKKYIALRRGFSTDRFVFVEAGFREEELTQFWLVPKGIESPKPAPTLKKMKYRKGKAYGFCTECCGS